MAPAYEQFIALYEEFEVLEKSKVIAHLEHVANNYCAPKAWGKKQQTGIMLLTAHLLYMKWQTQAQVGGAAAKISSGETPSMLNPTDKDLELTTYGRQYLELRNTLPRTTGFAI